MYFLSSHKNVLLKCTLELSNVTNCPSTRVKNRGAKNRSRKGIFCTAAVPMKCCMHPKSLRCYVLAFTHTYQHLTSFTYPIGVRVSEHLMKDDLAVGNHRSRFLPPVFVVFGDVQKRRGLVLRPPKPFSTGTDVMNSVKPYTKTCYDCKF